MSHVLEKSPKHCAAYQRSNKDRLKKLYFLLPTFFTFFLAIIFITWLILRPARPVFSLKELEIHQLTSSVRLTLVSKNPNERLGVYYDELNVHAEYERQQITSDSAIPPFFQRPGESSLLTATLIRTQLDPLLPATTTATTGKVVLELKVRARVRWQAGSWVFGKYSMGVSCGAVVDFGLHSPTYALSSNTGALCSTGA